jgi:outer membrane protein OmpA-like peptidoglycan-associated protein
MTPVVKSLLLTLALPVAASAGDMVNPQVWLVPGGGVAWPAAELGFAQNHVDDMIPQFGGILGVKIFKSLGIEARANVMSADEESLEVRVPNDPGREFMSNLEMFHVEGNLTWFLGPTNRFVPLLTAGAGIMNTEVDEGEDNLRGVIEGNTFTWNVGGGMLVRFTDRVGLRLDARRLAYEVSFDDEKKYRPHTEAFAGLNIGFGGKPADADNDGISDKTDSCPETPVGARVDARGCPIDTDSDGIADGLDLCDNTPVGAKVDASGCPTDADKDGIVDGIDQCANTPAGVKVNARGCPLDADGDGVADGVDKCEGTPKGCLVDATGCPSDADTDGVCDGLDQCANTPADARVDAKGCPIVVSEKETELLDTGMIRLQNVNFDTGKATIKSESHAVLDEVGAILVRWPELQVEIGGHADSQGSNAFNLKLSDDRAKSVLDYLQGKFPELKTAQITAVGYGEEKPIAPNNTSLGRSKNRRVEFKVLNTDVLKREKEKVKLAPK